MAIRRDIDDIIATGFQLNSNKVLSFGSRLSEKKARKVNFSAWQTNVTSIKIMILIPKAPEAIENIP